MSYKPVAGETEFGGVGGMVPAQQREYLSLQQEVWGIYATNEGGAIEEGTGLDTASIEWGLDHVGEPRTSFTYDSPTPDLTAVAPWDGSEEEA